MGPWVGPRWVLGASWEGPWERPGVDLGWGSGVGRGEGPGEGQGWIIGGSGMGPGENSGAHPRAGLGRSKRGSGAGLEESPGRIQCWVQGLGPGGVHGLVQERIQWWWFWSRSTGGRGSRGSSADRFTARCRGGSWGTLSTGPREGPKGWVQRQARADPGEDVATRVVVPESNIAAAQTFLTWRS